MSTQNLPVCGCDHPTPHNVGDGFHTTSTTASSWNGPICPVCNERYLGIHECKGHRCAATAEVEQLRAQVAEAWEEGWSCGHGAIRAFRENPYRVKP